MKKRFMSAMCLLLIACMSISLVACNGDDKKKPGPDETECTVHVDADTNGECDKCGEPVEIVEPGTDDPAIDVVTDVPNAVKLFNELMSGDVSVAIPDDYKMAFALSNVVSNGDMFADMGEIGETKITINGNMIHVSGKDGDTTMNAYLVVTEDGGYYGVSTDGVNYEYVMEPGMVPTDDTDTTIPEVTVDDIYYDQGTGYFVVKSSYLDKVMEALQPETDTETDETLTPDMDMGMGGMDSMLGIPGLEDTMANMQYEIKFKVSSDNRICELNVKGAVTQNDIRTEHLSIVYKTGELGTSLSVTINYYVNINLTIKYEIVSDVKGKFSVSMLMVPPVGAGMETEEGSISVDVDLTKDATIELSDAIKAELDKVAKAYENSAKVDEKYAGKTFVLAEDCDCSTIVVFDSEYNMYVEFDNFFGLEYVGAVIDYDAESACLGTINGNVVTVTTHCDSEMAEITAATKYAGEFTCESGCKTIAIFDEALGKYVMFEQDFFDEEVYEFYAVMDEPWGAYCEGTVDLTTKTLTVTDHSSLESIIAYVSGRQFTAIGYDNCDTVQVYDENSGYYISFYMWDGKLEYCGYSSFGGNCEGTLDVDAGTITITSHKH